MLARFFARLLPTVCCGGRRERARSRRFSGGLPAACCSATSTPRAIARCLLRRRRGAFAVFSGDLPAACCSAASTPARPRPLTHTPRAPAPLLRLQDILKEFSKEVIRVQPADILAWSAKCVGAPQRFARATCGPTLTPLSPAPSSPPATLRKRRQKLRPRVAAAAAGGEKCAALLIKQLRSLFVKGAPPLPPSTPSLTRGTRRRSRRCAQRGRSPSP